MNKPRRIVDHPVFRVLVLGILSIPLVLMITTPRQKAQKEDALQQRIEQQVSEPDSYMTQLHLKHFTADGALEYEFHSRRASRQADTNTSFLNEPHMVFLETATPWTVESNFGRLIGTGQAVELWDNVHAYRADDSMHIHTSALTLYPERDYAESDRAVTISGNGSHTDAIGLEAYLKDNRMRLLSDVRSIHEAKRP